MKLSDLAIILLPNIAAILTSSQCKMDKSTASSNPARPPSIVFGIVWPILYIMIGVSWVNTRYYKPEPMTDALYVLLNVLLNLWIVYYSCKKDIKGALYILVLCILATLILIVYGNGYLSTYLLLPLLVWLLFATMLNYTEVQNTLN
jgi:benzodiazapine receptor